MAPAMTAHLAPEAMVILSGLLPHQTRSVIAAYRTQGLVLIRPIRIDGWCSLLMQNRG
jgi:ribosomal protein L11 methyltransferase